jgi:hypothetical protein
VTDVHPRVEQRAGIGVVRVGRKPDPLAFVPMQHQTWAGRFDDPDRLWRTLYTASGEHGAWVEVLGRFRVHPDTQAALDEIAEEPGDVAPVPAGTVSLAWLASRSIGHAKVMARVADLASADTLRWLDLRPALRPMLDELQIKDLDLSVATAQSRPITQAIARELRLHADAHAIQYPSRYGAPTTCYALFESTGDLPLIEPVAPPAGADLKSEALTQAMVLHGLQWEE